MELFHFLKQRVPMDLQHPCRLRLVPTRFLQSLGDEPFFKDIAGLEKTPPFSVGEFHLLRTLDDRFEWNVFQMDRLTICTEDHEPLNEIFEFPDVPRPVVLHEGLHGLRGKSGDPFVKG